MDTRHQVHSSPDDGSSSTNPHMDNDHFPQVLLRTASTSGAAQLWGKMKNITTVSHLPPPRPAHPSPPEAHEAAPRRPPPVGI